MNKIVDSQCNIKYIFYGYLYKKYMIYVYIEKNIFYNYCLCPKVVIEVHINQLSLCVFLLLSQIKLCHPGF